MTIDPGYIMNVIRVYIYLATKATDMCQVIMKASFKKSYLRYGFDAL